jgi:wyosine [tRNA(Phe)-imidazoG37] synthetase (radical SAM superfamily)
VEAVCRELDLFWSCHEDPDYITFSGSGEPTLNRGLGQVIAHIRKNKPEIRVAVITNATLMADPLVRDELALADLVMPSLDAVTQKVFRRINRPCSGLEAGDIVDGLVAFTKGFSGEVWLEIFVLPNVNDTPEELALLKDAIRKIHPHRVQLNTLDRPGTVSSLRPASREDLERVMRVLGEKNVEIIARAETRAKTGPAADPASALLKIIHRRPCTKEDLAAVLGLPETQIEQLLSDLSAAGRITSRQEQRGEFFFTVKDRS